MGLAERLEFILDANPSSAIGGFNALASASENSLAKVESNVAKVGKSMLKLGGAGMGVGGLLTQIASGDEQAAGQLKASISSAGQVYSDFSEEIEKAVQSQVRFGHTDEETKTALGILVGSFNDTGKALDEMQLVTDLAARKNVSLSEAAAMVAKAHGGAGRVFKEFNIQVGLNKDGTKDYDGALSQLADKLKGQAAAGADTATGRFKALKAEVENIVSEFGQKFGPALLVGSTALTALGGATTAVAGVQARHAAAAATAAAAQEAENAALLEGVAANEAFMASASGAVTGLYAEEAASSGLVTALGAIGVVAGIAAVAVAGYGASSTKVSTDVHRLASDSNEQLITSFKNVAAFGGDALDEFLSQLKQGGTEGVGTLQRLRDSVGDMGVNAEGTAVFTRKLDAALVDAKASQDNLTTSVDAGNKTLGDTPAAAAAAKDAIDSYRKSADDTANAIDRAVTAQHGMLSAQQRAQVGGLDIENAQARRNDAAAKLGTGKTAAENAQYQRDYERANIDVTLAVDSQASALAELKAQQDEANGHTDTAVEKTDAYRNALGMLNDTQTGDTHNAIQGQINDLDALNQRLQSSIQYENDLRDAANGNWGSEGPGLTGPRGIGSVQHRASGGAIGPGDYLVGEQGPERMRIGADGRGYVWNAGQTRAMSAGSDGGFHVGGITVVNPPRSDTPGEIVRALRRSKVLLGRR